LEFEDTNGKSRIVLEKSKERNKKREEVGSKTPSLNNTFTL